MGIAGIGRSAAALHLHFAVIHLRQYGIHRKSTDSKSQNSQGFYRNQPHDTTTSRNMPASI